MKASRTKQNLVPISFVVPSIAYLRIKQEARRRKVGIWKVIDDLIMASPNFLHTKDPQLEADGFYQNVDWDDEEEAMGVLIAERAMQLLPPSRRELQ